MSNGRRKKGLKKETIVKIVVVVAVVGIGSVILLQTAKKKVRDKFGSESEQEVISATVTTGSIKTTVTGSGTLTNQESEDLTIPSTVDVKEIYVKAGENVAEGDMIASVNSSSVVKAMSEVQEELDAIDDKISDLEDSNPGEKIQAGVAGRVKKIYAKDGDDISSVMYENNALMLISVDGKMAVDIETEALKEGDEVVVVASDGTEFEGSVDAIWAGKATILVTDEGTTLDDTVQIKKDDQAVGSGALYIHEELKVTGYNGTVSSINVSEESKVSSSTNLITLTDTSNTVNYATLLEQRNELEDTLMDLIVIYKEGAVYAKEKGLVSSITQTTDDTTTTTTTNSRSGEAMVSSVDSSDAETQDTVISICPTDEMTVEIGIDETDILALEVGQEVTLTVDSLGEDTYTGELTKIDTVGTSSSGVTTYTATVTVEKAEGMLNGMTASAVITIQGKEQALLVPEEAVHETRETSYVYTSYNKETGEYGDMVEVVTGMTDGTNIEVTEGLKEGDVVYYQEKEENVFGGFGGFDGNGMPSGMPSGGDMPSGMPSGGPSGGSGSGSRGGGQRPSGFGK